MRLIRQWKILTIAILIPLLLLYGTISWLLTNGVTKADRTPLEHTPAKFNLPYQKVEFLERGGPTKLQGWIIPSTSDRTIIFIHGLGGNRTSNDSLEIVSNLKDLGFNTLLFDLRGHGDSDIGRISGGYFEQNDVLGAYDHLQMLGFPREKIGLLGFSLGAATGIMAAASEEGIQAVVADSPYANITDLLVQEVSRTTPIPSWIIPIFIPGTKLAANLVYNIKISKLVPEDSVTVIDYPVFIIHGEDDSRIPVDHGLRVHNAASDSSEIWIVPDLEHNEAFQNYPDEYISRIAEYFMIRLGGE